MLEWHCWFSSLHGGVISCNEESAAVSLSLSFPLKDGDPKRHKTGEHARKFGFSYNPLDNPSLAVLYFPVLALSVEEC